VLFRSHRTGIDDLLSSMLPEYRPVYTLGSRSLPSLKDAGSEDVEIVETVELDALEPAADDLESSGEDRGWK